MFCTARDSWLYLLASSSALLLVVLLGVAAVLLLTFAVARGMWKASVPKECNERGTCSSPAP